MAHPEPDGVTAALRRGQRDEEVRHGRAARPESHAHLPADAVLIRDDQPIDQPHLAARWDHDDAAERVLSKTAVGLVVVAVDRVCSSQHA